MNNQPSREEVVFYAASEIQDPEARTAYLEQVCGADVQLRQAVEALLRESARPCDFLEQPPLGTQPASPSAPDLSAHRTPRAPRERPDDRLGL